ncbi:MAG TPA: hypothetical protein VF192_08225 [Longimicrobiales bacterium]
MNARAGRGERLRIIVSGLIAQYPLGGMTWHYLQYLLGLAALGHDVHYFEDSGGWPYDVATGARARDPGRNVRYLAGIMARHGLADRWAYRIPDPHACRWFGMTDARRREVVRSATLLIDVSGTLDRPEAYRPVQRLAYVDTDPVFLHIRLARGERRLTERIAAYDVHFSFGECVGDRMPATGYVWRPMRQPIVVSAWRTDTPPRPVYTTVMNWSSYRSEVHEGRSYGQKSVEFLRFLDLPLRLAPLRLEIAAGPGHGERTPVERLRSHGWRVRDAARVCPDPDRYRRYIQRSKGEWSAAKNAYVLGRAGWFSERSACYLAAGRPVVVQDTGFPEPLRAGAGIVPFATPEEAVAAVREVEGNYARHAAAARTIAEEYFRADVVLRSLVERALA